MELTPEEWKLIAKHELYDKYSDLALSSLSRATITTEIQKLKGLSANPRNIAMFKYMGTLLRLAEEIENNSTLLANNVLLGTIDADTNTVQQALKNGTKLARMAQLGFSPTAQHALKRATGTSTLADGALASASAISAVVGEKIYVEYAEFDPATNGGVVSGEAVDPGASIVTIEDEDGNDMGIGVIRASGKTIIEMTEPTSAVNKAVHLLYSAGPLNHMEESVIYWTMFYREL